VLARVILLLFLSLAFHLRASAQDVRIGVFGLFRAKKPSSFKPRARRSSSSLVHAPSLPSVFPMVHCSSISVNT